LQVEFFRGRMSEDGFPERPWNMPLTAPAAGANVLAMPRIAFTRHLETVGPCEPAPYPGATVGELIAAAAADHPRLKAYVLDDQGRLRKHIAVFVDGAMVPHHRALTSPVDDKSEVYVFQALSGG
jgi:molybdopterin synthase sulfur carrier subunit